MRIILESCIISGNFLQLLAKIENIDDENIYSLLYFFLKGN